VHPTVHIPLVASQTWPEPHVEVPAAHAWVDSLHVSAPLHAIPSSQLRGVPVHALEWHVSPLVQNIPSSQLAPSFGLNAVRERAVSHTSHAFDGFGIPFGVHVVPTRQPVAHIVDVPASVPVSRTPTSVDVEPSVPASTFGTVGEGQPESENASVKATSARLREKTNRMTTPGRLPISRSDS